MEIDPLSLEIESSTLAIGALPNDATYAGLGSMIYHSYVAHELLCLYADISLWYDQHDEVLRTFKSFEAYIKMVRENSTSSGGIGSDLLLHSKIEILATKVLEAGMVRRISTSLIIGVVSNGEPFSKSNQNLGCSGFTGFIRPHPDSLSVRWASVCSFPRNGMQNISG